VTSAGVSPVVERVGEARAVHVQAEPARLGQFAEGADFGGTIDQAIFGRIGERDDGRLDLVDVVADGLASRGGHRRGHLRPGPVEQHQLGAAGKEAGRAGFVDFDMRIAVAQDCPIRRTKRGEAEAIGRGAGRDPEGADLGLK